MLVKAMTPLVRAAWDCRVCVSHDCTCDINLVSLDIIICLVTGGDYNVAYHTGIIIIPD